MSIFLFANFLFINLWIVLIYLFAVFSLVFHLYNIFIYIYTDTNFTFFFFTNIILVNYT